MVSLIFRDKSGVSDVALVKGFPPTPRASHGGPGEGARGGGERGDLPKRGP